MVITRRLTESADLVIHVHLFDTVRVCPLSSLTTLHLYKVLSRFTFYSSYALPINDFHILWRADCTNVTSV